jgi:hypothetical protein
MIQLLVHQVDVRVQLVNPGLDLLLPLIGGNQSNLSQMG